MNYALLITVVLSLTGVDAFTSRFLNMKAPDVTKSKVLIIQNKGGGHGEIGFQLCKSLQSTYSGVDITVLQDEACNYSKPPFSKYESELTSNGIKILNTKLTGDGSGPSAFDPVRGMQFDYVIDNWSKGTDNANCVIDVAKSSGASQHVFISSAGMYKTEGSPAPGATESSEVKENDARKVEIAVAAAGVPYTFLRPQYIYGPNANKRYLDYFIGRCARKLPVPVPLNGEQKVAITHIEDIASLVTAAVGKDAAMNEIFNCGTDNYISYNDLVKGIHKALGNAESDAKMTYYEPKDYPDTKFDFPFRRDTFVTSPAKVQEKLGWKSVHNVANDLVSECAIYEKNGGMKSDWSTDKELKGDAILNK